MAGLVAGGLSGPSGCLGYEPTRSETLVNYAGELPSLVNYAGVAGLPPHTGISVTDRLPVLPGAGDAKLSVPPGPVRPNLLFLPPFLSTVTIKPPVKLELPEEKIGSFSASNVLCYFTAEPGNQLGKHMHGYRGEVRELHLVCRDRKNVLKLGTITCKVDYIIDIQLWYTVEKHRVYFLIFTTEGMCYHGHADIKKDSLEHRIERWYQNRVYRNQSQLNELRIFSHSQDGATAYDLDTFVLGKVTLEKILRLYTYYDDSTFAVEKEADLSSRKTTDQARRMEEARPDQEKTEEEVQSDHEGDEDETDTILYVRGKEYKLDRFSTIADALVNSNKIYPTANALFTFEAEGVGIIDLGRSLKYTRVNYPEKMIIKTQIASMLQLPSLPGVPRSIPEEKDDEDMISQMPPTVEYIDESRMRAYFTEGYFDMRKRKFHFTGPPKIPWHLRDKNTKRKWIFRGKKMRYTYYAVDEGWYKTTGHLFSRYKYDLGQLTPDARELIDMLHDNCRCGDEISLEYDKKQDEINIIKYPILLAGNYFKIRHKIQGEIEREYNTDVAQMIAGYL